MVPLLVNRKGEQKELIEEARASGFTRLRINGEITKIADIENLDKRKKNTVEAVVDRLVLKGGVEERLTESVETALQMGNGASGGGANLAIWGTKESINYTRDHSVADSLNFIATWQAGMYQPKDMASVFEAQSKKEEPEFDDLPPARKGLG